MTLLKHQLEHASSDSMKSLLRNDPVKTGTGFPLSTNPLQNSLTKLPSISLLSQEFLQNTEEEEQATKSCVEELRVFSFTLKQKCYIF